MTDKKKISLPIVGTEDATTPQASAQTRAQGGDIMSELAHEVSSHRIVLYMKGTMDAPMCGFSHRAAGILGSYGIPVHAVNILADQEKRQAIKEFSNWPTIPQVYVDGEFLGGSDILTQMYESGQLDAVIAGK